jgi:hypothetical protein
VRLIIFTIYFSEIFLKLVLVDKSVANFCPTCACTCSIGGYLIGLSFFLFLFLGVGLSKKEMSR